MKILVTGGLGYIGSHTVVALFESGYEVIIVDDLSNSYLSVLEGIEKICGYLPLFEKIDLKDKDAVDRLFKKYEDISGVIHFAALKAVGESVYKPLEYYENNITPILYILKKAKELNRQFNFIFSSSCTVYGQADSLPILESAEIKKAQSPYGNTKQIGEEILEDTAHSDSNLNVISLRYFNPIGAHPSLEIGELPIGKPQNLVPFITQTAIGILPKLIVFGNDYPTKDGTCVRDYIHVVELAKAHVIAFEKLLNKKYKTSFEIFNLGTGTGSTVKEVIESFEKVSGKKLMYEIGPRRKGDVVSAYADVSRANRKLGWKAILSLDVAIESAWNWEKKIKKIN
jgi:UDP-glucose 4-epimerase